MLRREEAQQKLVEVLENCKPAYQRSGVRTASFNDDVSSGNYVVIPVAASVSSERTTHPEFMGYIVDPFSKSLVVMWERAKKRGADGVYYQSANIQPEALLPTKYAFAFGYAMVPPEKLVKKPGVAYHPWGLRDRAYERVSLVVKDSSSSRNPWELDFDKLMIEGLESLEKIALSEGCNDVGPVIIEPRISYGGCVKSPFISNLKITATGFKKRNS